MHPTHAQALPKLAAQIDTERPLIARAIADHTTIEINTDLEEITLHISDEASYELLTTTSQLTYLRQAFDEHDFRSYTLRIERPRSGAVNTVPAVNDVTPSSPPPSRTRTMLTLPQRAQLLAWVEAHRAEAATTPDATLATHASEDLLFSINASHVRTIRDALGIAKTKPEPTLPEGITLAELQKQLNTLRADIAVNHDATQKNQLDHAQRLDDYALEATGIKATIAALHERLRVVIAYLAENSHITIPQLPPLSQSGQ